MPNYAVISVGANNQYSHPSEEVISRLQDVGAEVVRTDESGTIEFISDGRNIIMKED